MGEMAEYYMERDFPDDEFEEYQATKEFIERNMNTSHEPEPDVPEENPSAGLPLAVVNKLPVVAGMPTEQVKTAQQLRVMEVSEALAPAYAKASTLDLTEAEINGLLLPFPDEKVEIRPHDGLIYIPHIHISNRLNQVFSPGKWSLICRRHWLDGNTMYGEYILLIKGCYVGESVGGHPYQPNNPKVNYSDTLESTAAEALRRIAGKRLSCGSQVWDPDYARNWVAKYAIQSNGKWHKKTADTKPSGPQPKQAVQMDKVPPSPEKCLAKFIENLEKVDLIEKATQFFIDLAWLMPNEPLKKIPLRFVPMTGEEYANVLVKLTSWSVSGKAEKPFEPHWEDKKAMETAPDQPPAMVKLPPDQVEKVMRDRDPEWWRDIIVPIPHKDQSRAEYLKNPDTIGSLYDARHDDEVARKRLWWMTKNYEPKAREFKGKTYQPSKADHEFRRALDAFADYYEKNHPDERL